MDRNTKIGIVGLGVLGGSYACGLSEAGFSVTGVDIDAETISLAKERGWIEEGGSDPTLLSSCDIVVSCLYPNVFVQWIQENQKYLKSGSLLTDVTGVKRKIITAVNDVLRDDVEFIACHPMAGRESKGILYADSSRFIHANFLIVPTENNTEYAKQTVREMAEILQFGHIKEISAEMHDRMIGYLSQLTHVIAVSLMNANDNPDLSEFTGDSFRDLTRIANINESLWPQLFILNKDYLLEEIDSFCGEMQAFRSLIENEDEEGMKEKLISSTERRKHFEKK